MSGKEVPTLAEIMGNLTPEEFRMSVAMVRAFNAFFRITQRPLECNPQDIFTLVGNAALGVVELRDDQDNAELDSTLQSMASGQERLVHLTQGVVHTTVSNAAFKALGIKPDANVVSSTLGFDPLSGDVVQGDTTADCIEKLKQKTAAFSPEKIPDVSQFADDLLRKLGMEPKDGDS